MTDNPQTTAVTHDRHEWYWSAKGGNYCRQCGLRSDAKPWDVPGGPCVWVPPTPETGWLIESNHIDGTPYWFALGAEFENGGWTKDTVKALRFARKRDAEAYIYDIGWTAATATEHAWDVQHG